MAVLFADVAGSTQLYDSLGDSVAKTMVDECLAQMRSAVEKHGGRVIKALGDELMCVFPAADLACLAASEIQHRIKALPAVGQRQRAVRVGWHYGPVIEENNDVFGDTVNLAARMVELAKATQIISTRESVERLPALLRASSRRIAALAIKGKDGEVEVFEVIWQADADLTMVTPTTLSAPSTSSLQLECGRVKLVLERANASLVLGRDSSCQLVVADRMASRQHARIERRQDKFFLIDQSSNGTFISFDGKPEIRLQREELMLRGQGRIAFGRSIAESTDATVAFSVHGA